MSNTKRTTAMILALGLAAATVAGGALAAVSMEKVVATRQANFKALGAAFKAINDQLKADTPDLAVIRASAKKAHDLARAEPHWFPKGSGPESGTNTKAKPEIWSDPAGFKLALASLETESGKLVKVSAGTDIDAIKAQVKATGMACGGCHNKFKVNPK